MSDERFVTEQGGRLDKLLAERASIGSREKARRALRSGKVEVDGAPCDDGSRLLGPGASIAIAWNRPGTALRLAAGRTALHAAGVQIVASDEAIVVCDKPAGLLTDAADEEQARLDDTLLKRVRAWAGHPVWPVHRIDRHTTGLVCFARTEADRARLQEQWSRGTPLRAYIAVVHGVMAEQGQLAHWMAWDKRARMQRLSQAGAPGAVLARARWRLLERFAEASCVEVELQTGRRNQIRLQAASLGHPLIGERLYGEGNPRLRHPRYALHAGRLGFDHPRTGAPLRFESPLPDDLVALLAALRAERPGDARTPAGTPAALPNAPSDRPRRVRR